MKKLFRLLYTLRYLKVKQVWYRVYFRIRKPRLYSESVPKERNVLLGWSAPLYVRPATDDGQTFTFLGITAQLRDNWNAVDLPKLWVYNLHYQDDLNAIGVQDRLVISQLLVNSWIAANPPLKGNGWEPYCISLRVVNWVKWLSRQKPEDIKYEWRQSLANQLRALEQQLEHHILANHLFANSKALIFGGIFFGGQEGDQWLKKGLKLIDREVVEQFCPDGAHYELSPMYHALLIWDLCDLLHLQQETQLANFGERAYQWQKIISQGIDWLRKLVHPDGDIAFFNDATLGVAPRLQQLEAYAEQLGCLLKTEKQNQQALLKLCHLKSSGYVTIDWPERHRLFLDVACIGPDYQPGHAHADTLSFELSLYAQRVFVNSGISQYGEDAERHRQRSTAAHNTVEVDGENSSEVWAGFRVARRARPFALEMFEGPNQILVGAAHDGYQRLPGRVVHRRQWCAGRNDLHIEDQLIGQVAKAIAFFHLHPDVLVQSINTNQCRCLLQGGEVFDVVFEGGGVELQASTWHPKFGATLPSHCLVVSINSNCLRTNITWS